jgi:hypothetical protein
MKQLLEEKNQSIEWRPLNTERSATNVCIHAPQNNAIPLVQSYPMSKYMLHSISL